MRLLLVDDDEPLMEALSSRLSDQRYAIDIATKGDIAWEFISLFTYDLVVLDRMLPNLDGVSLCQKLRAQGHSMPILMLTARGDNADVIDGLNAGADDYVVKPFDFDQLVARIHALLRRNRETLPPILKWGDLSLNPDTLEVVNGDRPLSLTPKEYAILELLLRNSNHVFTVDAIIDSIWTFDQPTNSAVRTHIKGLRQKLKAAGVPTSMIETVYGVGYRLTMPPAEIATFSAQTAEASEASEVAAATAEAAEAARKKTSASMAEATKNFKVAINERIAVLNRAATALKADELSDELHQQASSSAHKLAGALGSFGFPKGSVLAKEIEGFLNDEALFTPAAKQSFQETLKALRQVVYEQDVPPDETVLASGQLASDQIASQLASGQVASTDLSLAVGSWPLLLIVGEEDASTQAIAKAATACHLIAAIATSFSQAKAIIEADDPAILLLNSLSVSSESLNILERLHHQVPSRPIVAIADPQSLTERLNIIRRGADTLLPASLTPSQAIAAVSGRLKQTGAGAKVLIVDDDPHILQKIQIGLAPWGFEISTLDNPHEFLTVLDEVNPDLLVLDVEMPEVNGLELCQALRSEPRWNRLPVIFLTVHQDAKIRHRAFAVGADDYIEKPIIGTDLANRILNRLGRSRAMQP